MPDSSLTSLPRPVLFGGYGIGAALIVALTLGELTWWIVRPQRPPEVEPETVPISKPAGKLAVTASPRVSVYPGSRNRISVSIARHRFDGPVTVKLIASVPGLSGSELTIPPEETSGNAEIACASGVRPGPYTLTVTAEATDAAKAASASTALEVTVLALPPPPPRLAVSVPPRVQAYQRGKNTFAVRVARGDFDGAITLAFDNVPAGTAVEPVVIPAGKSEAVAELVADGGAKTGSHAVSVRAGGSWNGTPISAQTATTFEILASPKRPVDVVFAYDCTGSMKKTTAGVSAAVPRFGGELVKSLFDVRLGLVGFQDTTLAQPLRILRFGNEKFTADFAAFGQSLEGLRHGGGGGEGESSLDGVAEAADFPFRDGAVRVVLLITDGGPKRVDGRMPSMEVTVKHLREMKLDQLHILARPEHRKAFEPLWEGAKGKFFDLKEAAEAGEFDKLMLDAARAIAAVLPEPPMGKPDAVGSAPQPVLPPLGLVRPPQPPAGDDPEIPRFDNLAELMESAESVEQPQPPSELRRLFAVTVWAGVVMLLATLAILLGQLTFLPGERPATGVAAAGYSVGVVVGAVAGVLAVIAFGTLGVPLLSRLGGASLFGLGVGAMVPLAERFFVQREEAGDLEKEQKPLELDDAPLSLGEPQTRGTDAPHSPRITPPKPADGCPGCGRRIPGAPGQRYCMVCDKTY